MSPRWIAAIIISVVMAICITSIVVQTRVEPSFEGTSSLPLHSLTRKWPSNKDWNIVADSIGKTYIQVTDGKTLKVTYPAGSYNPSSPHRGGFQFYAQPKVFPAQQITFSYRVMFPSGFNWVKGGKLPGLWIGNMGANGGNHLQDGSSFRLMWRKAGEVEAYLYVPKQPNQTFYQQPGYVYNDEYGESLWRGEFMFRTNSWNNVTLFLQMNTPNNANGVIRLTINNATQEFTNMLWMQGTKQQTVNGLMMHTFFGGNDASWATPVEQNVYFRNFVVSNSV